MITDLSLEPVFKKDVYAYELLEQAKTFSTCKDKRVAAVAFYDEQVVGVSWNTPTYTCDGNCAKTNKKCAIHAEVNLHVVPGSTVYVSLFPCVHCQMSLFSRGVTEICVFGKQHKPDAGLLNITLLPDLAHMLTTFNGAERQMNVVIGEMAELTSALCNASRKDARDSNIPEELIDVELQLHCLRRIIPTYDIQEMKEQKYNKLITKFGGLV